MPDLNDLCREQADTLGNVHIEQAGALTEYRRERHLFAVSDAGQVELRLDPEVAEAARRTPATRASSRGAEWVAFAPPIVDEHASDRARAWFASAWRRAGRAE